MTCFVLRKILIEQEISLEQKINLDRLEQAEALFGSFDENVRLIEKEFGVALVVRDSELKITGEDPEGCGQSGPHGKKPADADWQRRNPYRAERALLHPHGGGGQRG